MVQHGVDTAKSTLWVVTECYYPEVVSTGQYLTQTAEGLTDLFEVKVICGKPNYLSRGADAPKKESRNGVEIRRVWSTLLNKNVLPYRIINMLTLGAAMFWNSVWNFRRGDKVLVVTAPPNLPFTTAAAALIKGASYNLLIHDYYPDQLIALGKLKRNSLLTIFMHWGNSWLFKHASRLIVVGRDMQELVADRTKGLGVPITTIPNWADLEDVHPSDRNGNRLLGELGIADKLVILSAGNIGRPTAIETVADCARMLRDDPRFHFVFVGWGAKGPWLKSFISKNKLSNVSVLGQLPREEQQEFLNACDVGLVSLASGMRGTAMPSRTYNVMAAGKPILALCDEGSELDRVISDDDIGWRISPGDPARMVETIEKIYEHREDLPEMGRRARKAAETKFSRELALRLYREVLR